MDEDGAMGNGGEPITGTSEKSGDLGGRNGGTDWWNRLQEGWNVSHTLKEEMKQKPSEQLPKLPRGRPWLRWKDTVIYIISEETSIFAPQRLRFYRALGVATCTVGKV